MNKSVKIAVDLTDNSGATATVNFNISAGTWQKTEPQGGNLVFKTSSGPYIVKGGSATELLKPGGGTRVGRFTNLDPASVQANGSGQGLSDDAGASLAWKVSSISS